MECPNSCQRISGNVSTIGGNVDLYIADPSGTTVLQYGNISSVDFKVSTPKNGTYVIHLANRLSTDNVTTTLSYDRDFNVVLTAGTTITWNTVTTWTATVSTPPASSNPWMAPLSQIGYVILTVVVGPLIVSLLLEVIRRKYQKYRDGESKTPVVLR